MQKRGLLENLIFSRIAAGSGPVHFALPRMHHVEANWFTFQKNRSIMGTFLCTRVLGVQLNKTIDHVDFCATFTNHRKLHLTHVSSSERYINYANTKTTLIIDDEYSYQRTEICIHVRARMPITLVIVHYLS